jgi:agmatine deiminase
MFHVRPLGRLAILLAVTTSLVHAQPAAPVRVIAEWEPAVGTLISWPLGIPQSLVQQLAADGRLFVLVNGANAENQARNTLQAWGVALDNVSFIQSAVTSAWTRDWGPHQIFDGNGDFGIVDPIFEGYPQVPAECIPFVSPGGFDGDDAVPGVVASFLGVASYDMAAYLTGGNFLVDGQGTAFSTCAMIGENQQLITPSVFFQTAEDYVGIHTYNVVNNTESLGIQHLDTWLKVLDEETLLVKRPPPWQEEYPRIEQNLQMLQNLTNIHGRPYEIIRIDCFPYEDEDIAAYTNSLILNDKVYVPLYDIPADNWALQTYRDAMPGYEVIGFPWEDWLYYDALHCRARAIFDRHMIRMVHRPLDPVVPAAPTLAIIAMIDDRSEAGLQPGEPRIFWRLAGKTTWYFMQMMPTGVPDEYAANIPAPPPHAPVEYYLTAADLTGRAARLPPVAPGAFYSFEVSDGGLDIAVPQPPQLLEPGQPLTFDLQLDAGDEQLVPGSAQLLYRYAGNDFQAVPLVGRDGDFTATLPAAVCADTPEFYVVAEGTQTGLKTWPPTAPSSTFEAQVGELELQILLSEGFETGLPADWSATDLWMIGAMCSLSSNCEGSQWAYFGRPGQCNYGGPVRRHGFLTLPPLLLPAVSGGGRIELDFCSALETEGTVGYDFALVRVNGDIIAHIPDSAAWVRQTLDLTEFAGQEVVVEFEFDSIDEFYNNSRGWHVDDVNVNAYLPNCVEELPILPGNADCVDGIDFDDISPFVAAIGDDEAAWRATLIKRDGKNPSCDFLSNDLTGDGRVDFDDITPFVAAIGSQLSSGGQ